MPTRPAGDRPGLENGLNSKIFETISVRTAAPGSDDDFSHACYVVYAHVDKRDGGYIEIRNAEPRLVQQPKLAEQWARESQLMKQVWHPHIAAVRHIGTFVGLPLYAQPLLTGGSLSNRRLRDEQGKVRPNPPTKLQQWLPAIAETLDYLHSRGMVHRDVKPANMFLDEDSWAYLGDFGIAKIVKESDAFVKEHTLMATEIGMGTPEYMAPEQFMQKAVIDGRADQYSLAVTVYEMLAGRRPFTGETAHVVVEVATRPAPPLTSLQPDLPASLVQAVHRGLSKSPDDRFSSCTEFCRAALANV